MSSHNVTIVITDDLRAKYPDGAEVFETKFSGKAQFVVGAVDYFVRKSRSQSIVSGPGSINYFDMVEKCLGILEGQYNGASEVKSDNSEVLREEYDVTSEDDYRNIASKWKWNSIDAE